MIRRSEWVGLICYWMAHSHRPALAQAIRLLQATPLSHTPHGAELVRYLLHATANPCNNNLTITESAVKLLPRRHRVVILLVLLYARSVWCTPEAYRGTPPTQDALRFGMDAAVYAVHLARYLKSASVTALFITLCASCAALQGDFKAAATYWKKAVVAYKRLAKANPLLYKGRLAHAFTSLGHVERASKNWSRARDAYAAAFRLRRWLTSATHPRLRPLAAEVASNFGSISAHFGDKQRSRRLHKIAVLEFQMLNRRYRGAYTHELALSLVNLGSSYEDAECPRRAAAHYTKAVRLLTRPNNEGSPAPKALLAAALNRMGAVKRRLHNTEAGRRCHEQALRHFRMLSRCGNLHHWIDVVITLDNLANSHKEMRDLPSACEAYRRAVRVLRRHVRDPYRVYSAEICRMLHSYANALLTVGKARQAVRILEGATGIARDLASTAPREGEPVLVDSLRCLGDAYLRLRNTTSAKVALSEAAEISERLFHAYPTIHNQTLLNTLMQLGDVMLESGHIARAHLAYCDAMSHLVCASRNKQAQWLEDRCCVVKRLARTNLLLGQSENAYTCMSEVIRLLCSIRHPTTRQRSRSLCRAHCEMGEACLAREAMSEAERHFRLALAFGKMFQTKGTMEDLRWNHRVVHGLGVALYYLGDRKGAKSMLHADIARTRRCGGDVQKDDALALASTLRELGEMHLADGEWHNGVVLLKDTISACARSRTSSVRQGSVSCHAHALLGVACYHLRFQGGRQRLREAVAHFERARRSMEAFRIAHRDLAHRQRAVLMFKDYAELYIRVCLELWDQRSGQQRHRVEWLRKAFAASESTRLRQVGDRLAASGHEPVQATAELRREYARARSEIGLARMRLVRESDMVRRAHCDGRGEEPAVTGETQTSWLSQSRRWTSKRYMRFQKHVVRSAVRHEAELDRIVDRIHIHDPKFNPHSECQTVDCVEMESMVDSEPATVLVHYTIGTEASLAIVVFGTGQITVVRLAGLNCNAVDDLCNRWQNALRGVLGTHHDGTIAESPDAGCIKSVLAECAALAIDPVVEVIPAGIKRVMVVPHRGLHALPLHAFPVEGSAVLLERFEMNYAPSAFVLHRCRKLERSRGGDALVLGGEDTGTTLDMPFAGAERRAVVSKLRNRWPIAEEVSIETRDSRIAACGLMHFCGHINFTPSNPSASGLRCRGGDVALGELLACARIPACKMVILSGCESGLAVPDNVDDYGNFAVGFLCAGAQCVVSTLWSIPDLPSALLMGRFYDLWLGGEPPATALRGAQLWLRQLQGAELETAVKELTDHLEDRELAEACRSAAMEYTASLGEQPFASPVYWAAYTCSGYGYANPGDPVAQGKTVV